MTDKITIPFEITGLEEALRNAEAHILSKTQEIGKQLYEAGFKGKYSIPLEPFSVGKTPGGEDITIKGQRVNIDIEKHITDLNRVREKVTEQLTNEEKAFYEARAASLKEFLAIGERRVKDEAKAEKESKAFFAALEKNNAQYLAQSKKLADAQFQARKASYEQWLKDITAGQKDLWTTNDPKEFEKKKVSRANWLDELSAAQVSMSAPEKEAMRAQIQARGRFLQDWDDAQKEALGIEAKRIEHEKSRTKQRQMRQDQIDNIIDQRRRRMAESEEFAQKVVTKGREPGPMSPKSGKLDDLISKAYGENKDKLSNWIDSLLADQKAMNRKQIQARGSFLQDLDAAQKIALGIEPGKIAHEKSRAKQRKMRQDQINELIDKRNRNISQGIMGGASAGIGLFGSAGFPLLNIAFASMSGLPYAGIAAAATAIGEAARYVGRLQDSAFQAAEGLGMLTKSFKIAKADFEVVKGMYGVAGLPAKERAFALQEDVLRSTIGLKQAIFAENLRGEYGTYFSRMLKQGPLDAMKGAFFPGKLLFGPGVDAFNNVSKDYARYLPDLVKARDEMYKQLNQYSARFETAEGMWQRIQQAAASPLSSDRSIQLEQLKKLDGIISELKIANEEESKKKIESKHRIEGKYIPFGVYE